LAALRRSAAQTRPWDFSTGPRAAAGKAAASRNALRPGERSAAAVEERRAAAALMRRLRREGDDDADPVLSTLDLQA
jgi:hypothetical protein